MQLVCRHAHAHLLSWLIHLCRRFFTSDTVVSVEPLVLVLDRQHTLGPFIVSLSRAIKLVSLMQQLLPAAWLTVATVCCCLTAAFGSLPFSYDLSTEGSSCSLSSVHSSVKAPSTLHVQLDAWGADSVRIRISPDDIIVPAVQGLMPFAPSSNTAAACERHTVRDESNRVTQSQLVHGNLVVTVDDDGSVQVTRLTDGLDILHTTAPPSFTPFEVESVYTSPYSLWEVAVQYAHAEGYVHGLGEHQYEDDRWELSYSNFSFLIERSEEYYYSRGGDIFIPWYVSQRGYGVLLNHPGFGHIAITNASAAWTFNATHQLDMWITTTAADSTAATPYPELMSHFADVTGHSNPLPHYASGFWQSKDRYRTQDEFLDAARGYHNRSIPVSVIVIDYLHWPVFGDWTFTEVCWPEPQAMQDEVHSYDMRILLSVWPIVDPSSTHFAAMNASDLLTHDANGQSLVELGSVYLYDAFNPTARQFFWEALVQGYVKYGIKLFWLDESEPDYSIPGAQWWMGHSDREVALAWVVNHQRMVYEGSLAAGVPMDEITILSRSTWLGHAHMNVVTWSGDTSNDFDALYEQILIAQNSQLSGIYWWTSDIGGYAGADLTDPVFQELLVRWFQFAAFCPIFRLHGQRHPNMDPTECGNGGGPNEVWTFKYSEQIMAIMEMREQMRPYVEEHLLITSQTGTPILTPMFYHFADADCYEAQTQFMFGPTYLVAPVYEYQATSRWVYLPQLPADESWMHVYSKTVYAAGWFSVNTTIDDFPLFRRQPSTAQHLASTPITLTE